MTTTKAVKEEITRFLESQEPEVLCITGKWGVGKTFLWQTSLQQTKARGALQLDRYAYVSLFGLNSLEDLRYALFENTTHTDQLIKGPSPDTLKVGAHWVESNARKFAFLLNSFPQSSGILAAKSAFLAVRNQLVCVDDLERHGKDLAIKDVLGLVSLLKEQRKCKVVILLNDEALSEDSGADFKDQLEKVVDTRVAFDPTPAEASEIGLTRGSPVHDLLQKNCVRLGIKNIRVIQKIERFTSTLASYLTSYEPEVLYQALHTATLFGWIHYQPKEAPPFDFVKQHNSITFSLRRGDNSEPDPMKENWHSLLSDYEFSRVDTFDDVVIRSLAAGAVDVESLDREGRQLDKTIKAQKLDNSFEEAWDLFHGSFGANADEVLDAISSAFKRSVQTISPTNLSGTLAIFKDLGRADEAEVLLDYYMEQRANEPVEFFDLRESVFGAEARDPDLRAAFEQKASTFADDRDPKEILLDMIRKSGWNPKDIARLRQVTAEEFKALFKGTTGTDLRRVIRAALQLKQMNGPVEQQIASRAEEALRSIGAESPINARRVQRHGITVSPPPASPRR